MNIADDCDDYAEMVWEAVMDTLVAADDGGEPSAGRLIFVSEAIWDEMRTWPEWDDHWQDTVILHRGLPGLSCMAMADTAFS